MNSFEVLHLVICVTSLAIPVILAVTALVSPQKAAVASGVALGLGFFLTLGFILGPETPINALNMGVRLDALTCVMLLLIGALGSVIVRYSQTYLQGDPGLPRYFRWFLLTSSAVTVIVVANNLLVLVLGWMATSLCLHQLLTFYADRTAALVAAHKKFLVSRLADVCLVGSLILVHQTVGSFDFDRIALWASANPQLSPTMDSAAILLVLAVALRSAQLPFHGWLMQVMEAPTPVSALLHAGVVNIGGFVMIRLAPWMVHAEPAQWLLLGLGLLSTTIAALVMTTRVSVKVALAWSTCSQVGFMLVECGLGLWQLALLHLVAHSLYKAHAFLSAGNAVETWRLQALTKPPFLPSAPRLGLTIFALIGSAILCATMLGQLLSLSTTNAFPVALLAILLGLASLPLFQRGEMNGTTIGTTTLRITAFIALYIGGHAAASKLMPSTIVAPNPLALALVGLAFVALFALKTILRFRPEGRLAQALYPWLFAGLYLDERFTRFTFRVWPPRFQLQRPLAIPESMNLRDSLEVRT